MSFMLLGILNAQAAGGGGGAFDLLETIELGSDTNSITFASIPQEYKHLQLRGVGNKTGNTTLCVRFNGNSSAVYSNHELRGTGTTTSSSNETSQTKININGYSYFAWSADPDYAANVIDILDYSSSAKNTTLRSLHGFYANASNRNLALTSGLWNNTSAVTSVTLFGDGDNLHTGTRYSLYGIKG